MSGHTPGPWGVAGDGPNPNVGDWEVVAGTRCVGVCFTKADANFVAAAPDLLDALRHLLNTMSITDEEGLLEFAAPVAKARAAIAKATSSSSREAAAPTSSPNGLERWDWILSEALSSRGMIPIQCASLKAAIFEAIRRSVEEALGAAASPLGHWQPIETAPKDGRYVLLGRGAEVLGVGDYWTFRPEQHAEGATDTWFINDGTEPVEPTHWLPLPKPPKEAAPNV